LNAGVTITNGSVFADSILTYSGAVPSTFTGSIRDGVRKLNLTVGGGTLTVNSAAVLNNMTKSTLTVAGGAVLQLNFTGTNKVSGLVVNGNNLSPGFYSSATSAPQLAGTGVIEVVPVIPATPTNVTFSVSGSTLSLSWPSSHAGWILQTQTNSLASGLSTNWVDVPGSGSITSTNITVSPSTPASFFRLRAP
jgi:hypothetical protein